MCSCFGPHCPGQLIDDTALRYDPVTLLIRGSSDGADWANNKGRGETEAKMGEPIVFAMTSGIYSPLS